jgi:hypothetical protein
MPSVDIKPDGLPEEIPDATPVGTPVEPLADSEEAEIIEAEAKKTEAEAKKIKAQATLVKAKKPLLDALIIRGLIPIALLIIGPWATWKFDADNKATQAKVEEQSKMVESLREIIAEEKRDQEANAARMAEWRERMKALEAKKAAELTAMSKMVAQLGETQRAALIQMAVVRAMSGNSGDRLKHATRSVIEKMNPREEVIEDVRAQMNLPGVDDEMMKRAAGSSRADGSSRRR